MRSNKSWCTSCDGPDAAARARRALWALDRQRRKDARRAYNAAYRKRPEVRARRRPRWREVWRRRMAAEGRGRFECAQCRRWFAGNRMATRTVDGVRVRTGCCASCAAAVIGPSRAGRTRLPTAEYHRLYRQRRKAMTAHTASST